MRTKSASRFEQDCGLPQRPLQLTSRTLMKIQTTSRPLPGLAVALLSAMSITVFAAEVEGFRSSGPFAPRPVLIHNEEAFARCYSRHVRSGMDTKSRDILERGCKRAATPKRCRDLSAPDAPTADVCRESCSGAGYLVRTLGSCSVADSL